MPAYKDKNTWYTSFYFEDWKGENKKKIKRGFRTKKEALAWEQEFKQKQSKNLDMSFESFYEIYKEDVKVRLKRNTWLTKEHIITKKILPTFKHMKISEITPSDVIQWQNEMIAYMDDKGVMQ